MKKISTIFFTMFLALLFQTGVSQNIIITELIQNPSAVGDTEGEWFELYNAGTETVDINGFVLKDADTDSITIENGGALNIEPNAYLVLGVNADFATNGGVNVDYQYSGMNLANGTDELFLCAADGVTVIDGIVWDDGATFPDPTGASMTLNPNFFNATDNDNGANWYPAITPYGDGDLGTPGAANDTPPNPSITVNAPNGGESWMQGTTQNITWNSVNFNGNVKIELLGANAAVLATSNANTGSFAWNIPADQAIADDYLVKISDENNADLYDESDATFSVIEAASFINNETFDQDLGTWSQYSVVGDDQVWAQSEHDGKSFAKMSGYDGGNFANEDWLISPALDLNSYIDETFNFESTQNYSGDNLQLVISTDYDGSSDPSTNGSWTDITDQANWSEGAWVWTPSGSIDLSSYQGSAVYIAFVYTSSTEGGKTWELDNMEIIGTISDNITAINNNAVSIYPNPSNGVFTVANELGNNTTINIFSITGQLVYDNTLTGANTTINVNYLPKGIYTVRVSNNANQNIIKKIVIK